MVGFAGYCQVLAPSTHTVKSTASKFLLNWLFQNEHDHRQWSAAISLGLVSSCLHVTDHKQKFENITGLIKVWRSVVWNCEHFIPVHFEKAFKMSVFVHVGFFLVSPTEGLMKYTSENYYERDQLRFFCKGLYKLYGICYKTVHAFRFCMAAKASSSKELVGLAWALHAKTFLPGLKLLIMLIWIKKSTRHRRLTY